MFHPGNRIGGVMVSVISSSAVDCGFDSRRFKLKNIKLAFRVSPLSTQH